MKTEKNRLLLSTDKQCGLEYYFNADWAGLWKEITINDPLSSHSRTGYVIMFDSCPFLWSSNMQPLIESSTTKS